MGGQIGNLRSNTYHVVKYGKNRSNRSYRDHFAQRFIFKKELTQAEHVARGACMLHVGQCDK